ncbi:MAG: hypothetical protein ABL903_07455 [Methylococcales bacterium]
MAFDLSDTGISIEDIYDNWLSDKPYIDKNDSLEIKLFLTDAIASGELQGRIYGKSIIPNYGLKNNFNCSISELKVKFPSQNFYEICKKLNSLGFTLSTSVTRRDLKRILTKHNKLPADGCNLGKWLNIEPVLELLPLDTAKSASDSPLLEQLAQQPVNIPTTGKQKQELGEESKKRLDTLKLFFELLTIAAKEEKINFNQHCMDCTYDSLLIELKNWEIKTKVPTGKRTWEKLKKMDDKLIKSDEFKKLYGVKQGGYSKAKDKYFSQFKLHKYY